MERKNILSTVQAFPFRCSFTIQKAIGFNFIFATILFSLSGVYQAGTPGEILKTLRPCNLLCIFINKNIESYEFINYNIDRFLGVSCVGTGGGLR